MLLCREESMERWLLHCFMAHKSQVTMHRTSTGVGISYHQRILFG